MRAIVLALACAILPQLRLGDPKGLPSFFALCACAVLLTGCATLDGISFGLDLANAETTVSFRHGDGKTVLAAEQDGKTVRAHFRR